MLPGARAPSPAPASCGPASCPAFAGLSFGRSPARSWQSAEHPPRRSIEFCASWRVASSVHSSAFPLAFRNAGKWLPVPPQRAGNGREILRGERDFAESHPAPAKRGGGHERARKNCTRSSTMSLKASLYLTVAAIGIASVLAAAPAQLRAQIAVAIDNDYIGGVVTGANGTEAGVWVIAETDDLPTRYAKMVVTDDQGRYVVPDLPKAKYKVWVRGYGLVDSPKVDAEPGKQLNLKAVPADRKNVV